VHWDREVSDPIAINQSINQSINCKDEWGKDPCGVDMLSNYFASTVMYRQY